MTKLHSVLDFLRSSRDNFTSGEEISRRLGVSRSAVWKEIQNLRGLGYRIKAQSHEGYRLAGVPDKMFADEISHGLGTHWVGRPIYSYEEIDSTNDTAFRLGEQGSPEGLCIFAEHQRKGRGRLGRSWVCPRGKGILFSILLKPSLPPSEVSRITLVAAVSVIQAIRKITGKTLGIRWPNDVLYGDKKVCGILTEMSAEADRMKFVVVGIGVNVNARSAELPEGATSLKEIAGEEVSRVDFAKDLLREIEKDMTRLKQGRFKELAEEWETYSVTSGRRITATLFDKKIYGQALGIDEHGALWIRKDSGLQERILSGDIQHLGVSPVRRRRQASRRRKR